MIATHNNGIMLSIGWLRKKFHVVQIVLHGLSGCEEYKPWNIY
jgi:hypothetical protein